MLKFLYEILVDPLSLPINPIWDYILIFIIGEIAHNVAYFCSPGGKFGSPIYWMTKLLAFVVVWGILYAIIFIAQFIIMNWIWFLAIAALLIGILIIHVKN